MDGSNAIIVCITFDAWIQKIRKTSLIGFGTITVYQAKICDLLRRFMPLTINLKGKQHSSPTLYCLQGMCFPCADSLQKAFRHSLDCHRVPFEVSVVLEPSSRVGRHGPGGADVAGEPSRASGPPADADRARAGRDPARALCGVLAV